MVTLNVRDFGPIANGAVKLRPLTVLIGPNDAGKSYLAMLTYALLSPFSRGGAKFHLVYDVLITPKPLKAFGELQSKGGRVAYRNLGLDLQDAIQRGVGKFVDSTEASLNEEIQRCFGTGINELSRRTNGLSIAVRQDHPAVSLELGLVRRELKLREKTFDLATYEFDFGGARPDDFGLVEVLRHFFPFLFTSSYYFPAARSGILQAHKTMASSMLSRLPLVGIERFEIPRLSGVVADFIGNLLRLDGERRATEITQIGDFLESDLCRGHIVLEITNAKAEYPEIFYKQGGKRFSLPRTSSMVSEIAPIVLFLKYAVQKGDLMIIEEPEAHLHPDNQRTFARAVVRLIRCGVQVLITTHSDYFVQQISNFIRLSADPELGPGLGYRETEFLRPDEVGAYLFRLDRHKGSTVEELSVTAENGIPEDEFVRIAEEIYDESAALDSKLSQ